MWTQKTISEKLKFISNKKLGLEKLWMDWDNHLEKNPIRKKTSNNQSEIAACEQNFLFRRDQNHYSNLTSKIMKMCEEILKKT